MGEDISSAEVCFGVCTHGGIADKCLCFQTRWSRILLLPLIGIVYWVGVWNLLNLYVLEQYSISAGYVWRDGLYVLIGTAGNVLLKLLWPVASVARRGTPFSWRVQFLRYVRLFASVSFSIVFWTGAWNVVDASWAASTITRDVVLILVSVPLLFLLDVIFSSAVLRYLLRLADDHTMQEDHDNIFNVWN